MVPFAEPRGVDRSASVDRAALSDVERSSLAPRSSRAPGMHIGHDVLLAVTLAFAFVLLGATTWFWTVR